MSTKPEHDEARKDALLAILEGIPGCAKGSNTQGVLDLANAWAVLSTGHPQSEAVKALPQA